MNKTLVSCKRRIKFEFLGLERESINYSIEGCGNGQTKEGSSLQIVDVLPRVIGVGRGLVLFGLIIAITKKVIYSDL